MYRLSLLLIASLLVLSVTVVSAQENASPLVELRNQYSGKCLTVKNGSKAHGAALIHKECKPGGLNTIWEMRPEGQGYRVVNRNSGLCLGVEHQSKKDGMRVTQVSPCTRADTLWKVENVAPTPSQRNPLTLPPDYGKTIVIRNNNSNKCLALVTGEEIKQYGCPPHRAKTTWQIVEPTSEASSQIAGRVSTSDYEQHLFPFYLNGKTYFFGQTGAAGSDFEPKAIGNAANWWLINDDPGTGLMQVVKRAKMSSEYKELIPFYIDRHPYIFGLHKGEHPKPWGKGSLGANIWRINNDGKGYELKLYKAKMSENYRSVISFQLRGEPYILGLHYELGANIWRIKEGPEGLHFDLWKYKAAKIIGNYRHFEVFYLDGHPHIFGLHDVGANIWRINDDAKGLELVTYGAKFHKYDFVSMFHVGGKPYVFAATMDKEKIPQSLLELGVSIAESLIKWEQLIYQPGKGYGVIWKIVKDPQGKLAVQKVTPKGIPVSHRYKTMITFEQGGKAFIFGVHEENYGNIWQVNDDPAKGFSLVYYGKTGKSINQIVSESQTVTR